MSQKTCGIPEACICGMCGKELAEPDYVDPETELKTLRAKNSELTQQRNYLRGCVLALTDTFKSSDALQRHVEKNTVSTRLGRNEGGCQ